MSFIANFLLFCAAFAAAEDLLFPQIYPDLNLYSTEYSRALNLNFTIKLVEKDEWANMTTADFAAFKAIILADTVRSDRSLLNFLNDTKDVWGPAVEGNVVLVGTDPSNHCCSGTSGLGAATLIDNSITFAAAGVDPDGVGQTGLYMAMSYYYDNPTSIEDGYVEPLSYFGNFTMRGVSCYNDVHIVSTSPALATLTDDALSSWSCSIHEAFINYPPDFQALAIARNATGAGSEVFGDESFGIAYIVSRGATPAKCGDGVWDEDLGEQCDDGNTDDRDGCDKSCRCEEGYTADGNGKCLAPTTSEAPGCPGPTATSYYGYPVPYPTGTGYSPPVRYGPYEGGR